MRKLRNRKLSKLTKAVTIRPRIQTLAGGFPRRDSLYYSVLPEFKLQEEKKTQNYKCVRSPIRKTQIPELKTLMNLI